MKTVLCYGDSNTYGYNPKNRRRYMKMQRWPGILSAYLGSEYNIIEEGLNGRTTVLDDPYEEGRNGLEYLIQWLKYAPDIDMAIIMLGSNDLKRCFHTDAAEIAVNAGRLVKTVQDCYSAKGTDPRIILVSPPCISDGIAESPFYPDFDETSLAESRKLADEYRKTAETLGCMFFDASVSAKAGPPDHVHLSPEAHQALAAALTDYINEIKE